jgi:hypothetical protein
MYTNTRASTHTQQMCCLSVFLSVSVSVCMYVYNMYICMHIYAHMHACIYMYTQQERPAIKKKYVRLWKVCVFVYYYMCPHTTIGVSSYHYICVYICVLTLPKIFFLHLYVHRAGACVYRRSRRRFIHICVCNFFF